VDGDEVTRPATRTGGYTGDAAPDAAADPLLAARASLEEVAALPLGDRAAVFEAVHTTVVEELRRLELG
jgi:hypothetical protein